MRRLQSVIGLCLVLSACTLAPAGTQDTLNEETFAVVKNWAADIDWEGPKRGTNEHEIVIDSAHAIPAGAMQAASLHALSQMKDVCFFCFGDRRDELTSEVEKMGWKNHLTFDADGASGTQWGYTITTPEGRRFLIMEAHVNNCVDMPDSYPMCADFITTATITDPLPADADL